MLWTYLSDFEWMLIESLHYASIKDIPLKSWEGVSFLFPKQKFSSPLCNVYKYIKPILKYKISHPQYICPENTVAMLRDRSLLMGRGGVMFCANGPPLNHSEKRSTPPLNRLEKRSTRNSSGNQLLQRTPL